MANANLYFLIMAIVVGALILFLDYNRRKKQLPPIKPTETPTVVKDDIEIGSHNYQKKDSPEETISVIDVKDGIVSFAFKDDTMGSLQKQEFVLLYEKRTYGRISKK